MRMKLSRLISVVLIISLIVVSGFVPAHGENEESAKELPVRAFTDKKSQEEMDKITAEVKSADRVRTYADFSDGYLVVSDDAEGITDAFTYQNVRGTGNVDLYYQKGTNLYRAVTISTSVKCDDINDVVQFKHELVATDCQKILSGDIRCKKCDNNYSGEDAPDNEIMYMNTSGEIRVFNKGDILEDIAGIEPLDPPMGIGLPPMSYMNAWKPFFVVEYLGWSNQYEITDRFSWSYFRGKEGDFIDVTGIFAHGGRRESMWGDIISDHSKFYVRDLFLLSQDGKFYYSVGNALDPEINTLRGTYSENSYATELPCKGVRGFVAYNQFPGVLGEDGKIYYWEKAEDVKDKAPLVAAEGIKEITVSYKDFYAVSNTGELLKVTLQEGKQPIVEHVRNNVERCLTSEFVISDSKLLFTGGPYLISEDDVAEVQICDNWWAKYEAVQDNAEADEIGSKKLIAKGVTYVGGDYFVKNGKVYKYKGKTKCIFSKSGVKAKKIWSSGENKCIMLDSKNNVWAYGDEINQFGYKKRNFKKFTKVLRNVKKVWVGDDDIAYIKNDKLYSFGIGDYYPDDGWMIFSKEEYKKYPLRVHYYKGINPKKIRKVNFSRGDLMITMKNGDVYNKVIMCDRYLRKSSRRRCIEKEDLLKLDVDDVVDCNEYMLISKNGVSRIKWFDKNLRNKDNSGIPTALYPNGSEESETPDETVENDDYRVSYMKNVKEFIFSSYKYQYSLSAANKHYLSEYYFSTKLPSNRIAMIMKNSDLYAWGNFLKKGKYFTHAVKVAENVKQATFLKGRKGIVYLTKKGRLYICR